MSAFINAKSDGKIQVAILSSKTFNAPVQVNMNSLTFGHSGAEKSLAYCDTHRADINHDGMADLVSGTLEGGRRGSRPAGRDADPGD